jgi:acyl carrier protein
VGWARNGNWKAGYLQNYLLLIKEEILDKFELSIAEIFEEDEVKGGDSLSSFEFWDSLTVLSIIAFIDDEFSLNITAEEVELSETVDGLRDLIKSKQK